jgi:protein-S-isoprenylcysteine O-methyltransferase Ste14
MNKPSSPERSALGASAALLVLALACIALFLPPLVDTTTASPLRVVATGLVLTGALLLHWVFLGIGCAACGARCWAGWRWRCCCSRWAARWR